MTLQEEIKSIIDDKQMTYEEKRKKLLKFMAPHEVSVMLPEPVEVIRLKEPLKPKNHNMRILRLSVHPEIFESILKGGHVECREYSEYYKSRCTYEEDGVRFLVPFDAITFFAGYGARAKWATVALKDIVLNNGLLYFHTGEIIDTNLG